MKRIKAGVKGTNPLPVDKTSGPYRSAFHQGHHAHSIGLARDDVSMRLLRLEVARQGWVDGWDSRKRGEPPPHQ